MYCGIDFGTSNSAIAIADEQGVRLAPVEQNNITLPSALFYPLQKPPVYGHAAMRLFTEGEEGRFMRSLKRLLGTELMNYGTLINNRPRKFDEIIGGTSDFTVIRLDPRAGRKHDRCQNVLEGETGHNLLDITEQAKIALTDAESTTANLGLIEPDFSIDMTRRDFEDAIASDVEKISSAIAECLALFNVAKDRIELVVLTGGPTETPLLKRFIKNGFPAAALSEDNKLSSVALGLGYDSARRFAA